MKNWEKTLEEAVTMLITARSNRLVSLPVFVFMLIYFLIIIQGFGSLRSGNGRLAGNQFVIAKGGGGGHRHTRKDSQQR
jgi:hypothetical protein